MHQESTVWISISSRGLLRPIFFEETSEQRVQFKHDVQYFCASPSCYVFAVANSVVMQGGARLHTAHFLHDAFDSRVISNRSWLFRMWTELAPISPDLNPCDYFLWGFLTEKICLKKPQIIMELKAPIFEACSDIIENKFHRVAAS
jgi:hypothetical protein